MTTIGDLMALVRVGYPERVAIVTESRQSTGYTCVHVNLFAPDKVHIEKKIYCSGPMPCCAMDAAAAKLRADEWEPMPPEAP